MDLRAADDSKSRFSAYVEGLVRVIGHADRAGPLRDYCVGLMMPCERKSVEPMAAVTAPGRRRRSISRCCISSATRLGRTRRSWPRFTRWCCRRLSVTVWSKRGLLTTPAFRRRAGTRLAWHGNIAASSASRITARLRCRCRLPITMQVCRWPTVCICRKTGRGDGNRRRKTGVPEDVCFKTKPEIALEQIDAACRAGLPRGVVLMDAGYGCNTRPARRH